VNDENWFYEMICEGFDEIHGISPFLSLFDMNFISELDSRIQFFD
jgi:hypothetical protein